MMGRGIPRPSSFMKPFQTGLKQTHDFVLDRCRPHITLLSYTSCPPVHTRGITHLQCSTPALVHCGTLSTHMHR